MKFESIAEKARYLRLSAFSIAEGMKTGSFASSFKGQGIEFDTVREYTVGDDVRFIDWNVSARFGKTYIKKYKEEREVPVFIVLDNSLSMQTGGKNFKKNIAFESSILLAFAAEQIFSPVGFALFDGELKKVLKPKHGREQVLTIIKTLENHGLSTTKDGLNKTTSGSVLDKAIAGCIQYLKSKSLVIILSDFRTSGYEKALGVLARKNDVIAVRITSPIDFALPQLGLVPFCDLETMISQDLPTNSESFQNIWEKETRESILRWRTLCLRSGVSPLLMSSNDDPIKTLASFFSSRKEVVSKMYSLENNL